MYDDKQIVALARPRTYDATQIVPGCHTNSRPGKTMHAYMHANDRPSTVGRRTEDATQIIARARRHL
jgi:hypothetical protein